MSYVDRYPLPSVSRQVSAANVNQLSFGYRSSYAAFSGTASHRENILSEAGDIEMLRIIQTVGANDSDGHMAPQHVELQLFRRYVKCIAVGLVFSVPRSALCANAALTYLGDVQDRYHQSYIVYEDISAAGNHFHAWSKIPDQSAPVTMIGGNADGPLRGATSIKATYTNLSSTGFGGFYLLNGVLQGIERSPTANFGDVDNAGIDLTGATSLSFWARGQTGGEKVEFFVGGVGRNAQTGMPIEPFPESFPRTPSFGSSPTTLTTSWQHFSIPLAGRDLSYVLGGLGWVATSQLNPSGATFYLDDVQFELNPQTQAARLQQPRFLRSFETRPIQPDIHDSNTLDDINFVLRNAASSYDNAVAGLGFMAEGSPDSMRRAKIIADSFVYATSHDRTFNDGRVRSFYAAGDIALPPGWTPNGRPATAPAPGFFDENAQTFYEVEQTATDTGNNAWPMIFLLHAHRKLHDESYLAAAEKIGDLIHSFRNNEGTYQGFLGGINGPESPTPTSRPWASTEHNIDVAVAARLAYEITGESRWRDDALHAQSFVESMFDQTIGLYRAGTLDPDHRNELSSQLPSDVNTWAVLSDPTTLVRHPQLLNNVLNNFVTTDGGYTGIDFNSDRDGVEFEMTAHLVLALRMAGRDQEAQYFLDQLNTSQSANPGNHPGAIAAASRDGLTTGFDTADGIPFYYFNIQHVGATAWLALAQLGIDPYTLKTASFLPGDYNANGIVDAADYTIWRHMVGQTGLNLAADGNGDQHVDGADYNVWRAHFGRTAALSAAAGQSVPEPCSSVLYLLSMLGTLRHRQAKCRSLAQSLAPVSR